MTAIEKGIIIALVALAMLAAMPSIGGGLESTFDKLAAATSPHGAGMVATEESTP